MKLHQRLSKARFNKKMSVIEIARKCRVSSQAVYNWETGKIKPRYATLMILSQILETDLTDSE